MPTIDPKTGGVPSRPTELENEGEATPVPKEPLSPERGPDIFVREGPTPVPGASFRVNPLFAPGSEGASPGKSAQQIKDETAFAVAQLLVGVVLEAARQQTQKGLDRAAMDRGDDAKRLSEQLRQIESAFKIVETQLSSPLGLSNPVVRNRLLTAILEYIHQKPALKKQYAPFVNTLALALGGSFEKYIIVGSVPKASPAPAVAKTPLEMFVGKSWEEICTLCGFSPREYQQAWYEGLMLSATTAHDRGLLGAPYQVGKTFASFPLAAALASSVYPGKRVLIVAPQRVVKDTIIDDLKRVAPGLRVGRIDANHKDFGPEFDVVIASPWTLGREEHLQKLDPSLYGVVASDEAKFVFTPTGKSILEKLGFLDAEENIVTRSDRFLFGFSADARLISFDAIFGKDARLDNMDLPWYVEKKFLHEPVGIRVPYRNIPDAGWDLTDERGESILSPKINLASVSQVYEVYKQKFDGQKVVVNCANIAFAEALAAYFNTMSGHEGFAYADHSQKSAKENQMAEEGFQKGTGPKVMIGVAGLAIGFRAVGAAGIINTYATTSVGRYGQRLGRVMGIHNNEPQREVLIVDMHPSRKASFKSVFLPQLLGIDDYPGDNIPHQALKIVGGKKIHTPVPKFKARLSDNGMGLEFEPLTDEAEKIVYSPTRYPVLLQEALERQFNNDIPAMAQALEMDPEALENQLAGHLPKYHRFVINIAPLLYPDNPARLTDAWINDYMDWMDIVYPAENWNRGSAVYEIISTIRRQSLMAEFDETGGVFESGFQLSVEESRQLGFLIRGEFFDEQGTLTVPGWQELVKKVLETSPSLNAELIADLIDRADGEATIQARMQAEKYRKKKDKKADKPVSTRPTWNDVVGTGNSLFRDLEMPIERFKEFGAPDELISALKGQGVDYFWQLKNVTFKNLPRISSRYSHNSYGFRELLAQKVLEDLVVKISDPWSTSLVGLFWNIRRGKRSEYLYFLDSIVTKRLAYSQATENQALILDSQKGALHGDITQLDSSLDEGIRAKLDAQHIYFVWQVVGYSEQKLIDLGLAPQEVEKIKTVLAEYGLALNFDWDEKAEKIREGRTKSERLKVSRENYPEVFFKRVDKLDLSVRSANCLQNRGIEYIWQLVKMTEAELLRTKDFGRKSLYEIKNILQDLGLKLGMNLESSGGAGMEEDAPDIFYDLDEETGQPASHDDSDMVKGNPHDGRTAALSRSLAARLQRPAVRINLLTRMGR